MRNDLPEVIFGTPPVLLSVQALPFERVALEPTGSKLSAPRAVCVDRKRNTARFFYRKLNPY